MDRCLRGAHDAARSSSRLTTHMNLIYRIVLPCLAALVVAGCSDSAAESRKAPQIQVFKNAWCGCCQHWVDHVRAAGFEATTQDVDNLDSIKREVGVPAAHGSCHTAKVDGYFIEGHVPAKEIKRLLRERPAAKGLVVPAMPLGSPGMEVPSGETQPYDVLLVDENGNTHVYAHYEGTGAETGAK
jgi:hypothetical protein